MITIPMTPKDERTLTTDHVLVVNGRYRLGIGSVPRGAEGRQVHEGPMVPGPWAYTYGLATVMAANPVHGTGAEMRRKAAENKVHHVATGDQVSIDGVTYEVKVFRRQFIDLIKVEDSK